jgi:hypothetical protein
MEELPSNSHNPRKPGNPKKIERIIEGEVITRKPPLGRRLTEMFIGGDAKSALRFVAIEVLLPAAKDAIADAFSQGIEKTLFGDVRSSTRSRSSSRPMNNPGYVSYNRYSTTNREEKPAPAPSRSSNRVDDIVLYTYAEAAEVIAQMQNCIESYDSVSVSDFYEMVGKTGTFTDEKWGWTDLTSARPQRVREGYLISLPRPIPLD